MKLKLPVYNGSDNRVMLVLAPLYVLLFNSINFGKQYVDSIGAFIGYTLISFVVFCSWFTLCGAIAVFFLKLFPSEKQAYRRIFLMLLIFLLNLGLVLYGLFQIYDRIAWFNYEYNETKFLWNYLLLGIGSISLTFFMEGVRNYNEWKKNLQETEKLDAAYRQSSLNALKSQVNPHFLFNSLNSLSSLIQEDEDKAEVFLNEMSKVYRYMLRTDDEQLVSLDTELKFISSYMHLLKTRYGDSIQLHTQIRAEHQSCMIPPLTLQVIIEHAFTQNILSKTSPLYINIHSSAGNQLLVQHNVQLKTMTDMSDTEAGLDNLVNKYKIMGSPLKVDESDKASRIIHIPLFEKEEVAR